MMITFPEMKSELKGCKLSSEIPDFKPEHFEQNLQREGGKKRNKFVKYYQNLVL
jgi:hypothetical protein